MANLEIFLPSINYDLTFILSFFYSFTSYLLFNI